MHPLYLDILRALFRLHRYRRPAELAAIELRVPLAGPGLRDAIRALERAEMLTFDGRQAHLTLPGLAVAAAAAKRRRPAKTFRVAA